MKRMMLLAGTLALTLCGCAGMHDDRENARCVSYGLKPGTPAYGECRMRLEELRIQSAAVMAGYLASRP